MRIAALLIMLAFICPAAVFAAEKLPSGFIAMSDAQMKWADAKNFCAQKGGKLPLVGGNNKLDKVPKGTSIDGFGAVGDAWPTGLPLGKFGDPLDYWTGTEDSRDPDTSWRVSATRNKLISVSSYPHFRLFNVLCVPK
jgi:hypothetical protein